MVWLGHLSLLGEGRLRWPPFYLVTNPRNTHLVRTARLPSCGLSLIFPVPSMSELAPAFGPRCPLRSYAVLSPAEACPPDQGRLAAPRPGHAAPQALVRPQHVDSRSSAGERPAGH